MFNEIRDVGNMRFDFLEKSDPMSYAVGLARKMAKFNTADDMAHLLRHTYVTDIYKPELLAEVAEILADPSKCIQLVSSKSFDPATLPKRVYWYRFNYSVEKFSEERLA